MYPLVIVPGIIDIVLGFIAEDEDAAMADEPAVTIAPGGPILYCCKCGGGNLL